MRLRALLPLAALALWMPQPAGATPLLIDFNSTTQDGGPHNQAGYQAYGAGHEVASDFVTQSYPAFGTTVSVTPDWTDTTDNRVRQMVDRGASFDADYDGNKPDLITDWIGVDTRTGNGGNGDAPNVTTLTLTLSGLPAGTYDMLSYHHDTGCVNGEFDVLLSDGNGVSDVGHFHMTASSYALCNINDSPANPGPGNDPDVLSSTVRFQLVSNGAEEVSITYSVMGQGSPHSQAWGMNGFELTLVPEPSPAALLLAGLAALARRRRVAGSSGPRRV
jgi:hypothetical protein